MSESYKKLTWVTIRGAMMMAMVKESPLLQELRGYQLTREMAQRERTSEPFREVMGTETGWLTTGSAGTTEDCCHGSLLVSSMRADVLMMRCLFVS